jgi:hypothetical protein
MSKRQSLPSLRSVARKFASKCASVPPVTPAYAFVALYAPRLSEVQRHRSSLLRSVRVAYGRVCVSALPPRHAATRVVHIETNRSEENVAAYFRAVRRKVQSPRSSKPLQSELRCGVASDQSQWRSLSEAIDQVLVSLSSAPYAPSETAESTLRTVEPPEFGRVNSPSNELASIWSVGAERSPPGIALQGPA